jgi:branched-chain amino acid transport system substrate-binding protein
MAPSVQAEIIVGVVGPMSGTYAQFGEQMLHGAQLAVDDINAKGGIAGERILLEPADDECDNRKAELVAQDLISKHVNVVIGHFCSNPALAAARLYELAGIPMLAPSATLPALTEAGLWNVLRIAARNDAQADVAAQRIAEEFPTAVVAVLNDGNASHVVMANRFTTQLGKAPALAQSFKPDATDFNALISEIKNRKIDLIYFACDASDAGNIAAGLQAAGVRASLFGADSLLTDLYWEKSDDAGQGTRVTFAIDPQSAHAAKPVLAALKAAGFDAGSAGVPAYAAVQLFTAAAEVAGAKNGKAIVSLLRSGKSFDTAFGALRFDGKGDVQPPRFMWYRWSNGAYAAESLSN